MLRLNNITKDYKVADTTVRALKGINISFRKNEFVSILGPSGCGKTTLLNIVGGLDKYTTGDLYIDGVSTKEFGDREWDIYRNHHIGFVFQSYNLIPHQTVLGNVELALTISGMSKEERTQKAKAALIKVGLESEINKRPNQLSGGQCQRVAIARALVNDPDILLADEPTGALDTETSKQIMDLVKEIAEDRLVIMVTHNPDLADQYSTRIVRLLDGNLLSDTNPLSAEEEKAATKTRKEAEAAEAPASGGAEEKSLVKKKKGKSKMSFWTAFKLSLNNLFSKKSRTIMTSIAGSIGIIGISLVLAFSYGIQGYITNMQNDMLSGNPIEISSTAYDMSSLLGGGGFGMGGGATDILKNPNSVTVDSVIADLVKQSEIVVQNDISPEYLQYIKTMPDSYNSSVFLDYGVDVTYNIFTNYTVRDGMSHNISLDAIRNIYTHQLKRQPEYGEYADFVTNLTTLLQQIPINEDYVKEQYNILDEADGGRVATAADEIMIVLSKNRQLNDLLLAQLGYLTQDQFTASSKKIINQPYEESDIKEEFSFAELKEKEFVWYNNDLLFKEEAGSVWSYNAESGTSWKNGQEGEDFIKLKVVGILEPKDNLSFGSLSSGIYFTEALKDEIIRINYNSVIAKYLRDGKLVGADGPIDTFYGGMDPRSPSYGFREKADGRYEFLNLSATYVSEINKALPEGEKWNGAYAGSSSAMGALLGSFMGGSGDSVYSLSLQQLGGVDFPVSMEIYSENFDDKQLVLAYLDKWNNHSEIIVLAMPEGNSDGKIAIMVNRDLWNDETKTITFLMPDGVEITLSPAERAEWNDGDKRMSVSIAGYSDVYLMNRTDVKYSDMLAIIIGMINQFINIITIALIGFTSLALVVSVVMISIITYVSVVERTKEIGVIRSLGGRKRDVGYLFNAETFILGAGSGLIGIVFTWLVSALINLIVKPLIGMTIAVFPIGYAIIMMLLSIGLTVIAGLVPSRSAAKKDPVVALRTE